MEILKVNAAARNLIRESEVHQIYTILETGSREGMITMNQWLYNLFVHGEITREVALSRSTNPDQMKRMLQQGGRTGRSSGAADAATAARQA
jgi:twitching motility protein PilT